MAYRILGRIQDALPSRGVQNRRVTPLSARREMQRRAAMAILSLVVVVGGLGIGYALLGGKTPNGPAIASFDSAQAALELAQANLNRVIGPGIDLVQNDPTRAADLLTKAYSAIVTAEKANLPASTVGPLKAQITAALDRLYGMVDVASSPTFTFPANATIDLRALVKGPDGAPFVLDAATKTVYRIDLSGGKATVIFREGNKAAGATEGVPKLLTVGGRDLIMVDSKNVVWRWRPANTTGKGTITRVRVNGATEWGDDILAIGTFIRNSEANLYNFYVVDPSVQQILRYSPAADGSGFPNQPNQWLSSPRDVSAITSLYIDGDIWLADGGQVLRVVNGNSAGLGGVAAGRRDPAQGARLPVHRVRRRPSHRHDLRLRRRERPGDRPLQGQRRVRRPVPARGRRDRLERLPRLVRRARAGPGARHARLDQRKGPAPRAAAADRQPARRIAGAERVGRERLTRRQPVIPLRDRNPTGRAPFVTFALIGACFAAFAIELSVTATGGDSALESFFRQWGAVPADVTHALGRATTSARRRSGWSAACSCTSAGCTCSATCCSCGSSATTSRTGSAPSGSRCSTSSAGSRRRSRRS